MKKILIVSVLLIFCSCRTAKKEWVKENYSSKEELVTLGNKISTVTSNQISSMQKTLLNEINEKRFFLNENFDKKENENTTVTGTIKAEEGIEKTAQVGNTLIKSNGSEIQFKIQIEKELSETIKSYEESLESYKSESEKQISILQSSLAEERNARIELQREFESYKESKSREVTKKGFTLSATVIFIGIGLFLLIIVAVYYYVKNKITI